MGKASGKYTGTELDPFDWDKRSQKAAALIAQGTMYHIDIAQACGVLTWRISLWKRNKEFMDRVNELTLECETATKAGLLREAYQGLEIKREELHTDKSTHLDYMREIADLQGYKKQQIELAGELKVEVTLDEAIEKYAKVLEELAK